MSFIKKDTDRHIIDVLDLNRTGLNRSSRTDHEKDLQSYFFSGVAALGVGAFSIGVEGFSGDGGVDARPRHPHVSWCEATTTEDGAAINIATASSKCFI